MSTPDPIEPALPGTKLTLTELFAKAGITPDAGATPLKSLRRDLQCLRFAQLYVENHFNPVKAYTLFRGSPGASKTRHMNSSKWMLGKETGPRIAFHIRRMVQEATERAKDRALLDVQELLDINQQLILADVTDLIEQVNVDGQLITRFRPAHHMTKQQRMSVKAIRIKDGEVTMMEPYDRLRAEMLQIALLELLASKGGSDQNWLGRFNERISEARRRKIAFEVEAGIKNGKVLRLPGAK